MSMMDDLIARMKDEDTDNIAYVLFRIPVGRPLFEFRPQEIVAEVSRITGAPTDAVIVAMSSAAARNVLRRQTDECHQIDEDGTGTLYEKLPPSKLQ